MLTVCREQDKEATVYVGNLDERVTDSLVWELMLQAGRIVNIHLPKDRVNGTHQGYGFVEFISEEDADYAAKIMNQVRLFGKPIRVNKASADKQKTVEVGAELFIGNLDPMVDEKMLYDAFGRFGSLLSAPKVVVYALSRDHLADPYLRTQVARDEANLSKGYGFVSYSTFEAADEAIANFNGQYLMNKEVSVQYAYKKDGKGERHGDEAERLLASQARKHNIQPTAQPLPAQLFSTPSVPASINPAMMGTAGAPAGFAPPAIYAAAHGQQAPARLPAQTPLPPPPLSGLPPRPPPSQAGYGGPSAMLPPGFGPPMGAYPPQNSAPAMAPPPGFPMAPPPGMAAPPGMPPGFPPQAYQQQMYGHR